jgi:hypothetical protein
MSSRRIPTEDREPDPARSYERAKPEKEAGMGRLDTVNATPTNRPGQAKETVRKVHAPHQNNANEVDNKRQAIDLTKKAPAADRRRRRKPTARSSEKE